MIYKNLLIGLVMLVVCIVIQCLFVYLLLRTLTNLESRPTLGTMTGVLAGVMLIMVTGNMFQMALWAALFVGLGEFQEFDTAFYLSVVNFTTLGYGDIFMSEKRRLLGAFEAGNGVLMLGLTTSVLYLVLDSAN